MGASPPFMYEHPSRYSFTSPTDPGFNPRAATQASWTPRPDKPKSDGPLINAKEFNKHPDSYFIVPYGNLDWKPMSPNTKTYVTRIRYFQLALRICAFLGALGMLFCVICVKGTGSTLGWIIRVPPGVSILLTIYAIYHLIRKANGRTPASSASYHLFAGITDALLLPFFVFSALMSHNQSNGIGGDDVGRWSTLFADAQTDHKIIFATFLFSVTDGGLHLLSLMVSIYLANVFRKISKLPPDANPLESNLTSRNHKRNKSSLSTAPTEATASNRDSHLSAPLIAPPRHVPFVHTRNESTNSLNGIPTSPNRSRPASRSPTRPTSTCTTPPVNLPPAATKAASPSILSSKLDFDHIPTLSPTKRTSTYTPIPSPPTPSNFSRPRSSHASLLNPTDIDSDTENWESYPSPTGSPSSSPAPTPPRAAKSPDPPSQPQYPPQLSHLRSSNNPLNAGAAPEPLFAHTNRHSTPSSSVYSASPSPGPANFSLKRGVLAPLEMNPPTPPNQQRRSYPRALMPGNGNANPGARRMEDSSWVGRGRGVGQLGIGQQGLGGRQRVGQRLGERERPRSEVVNNGWGGKWDEVELEEKVRGIWSGKERVVSSGREVNGAGRGMRAREVSGKVVEEGRGFDAQMY